MIALVLCLLAAPPQMDAKRAAAQLIDEGNELLDQKQYQAALARYEAAHALYPTPKIFFNMAEAHRELKNLVEAIEYYERFLAESGVGQGSPLRKESAKAIADLDQRIGSVTVEGGPFGAEVFIDGQPVGRLPLTKHRILPGFHQLVIQQDGRALMRSELAVKRGEELRVAASIEAVAPPPPPVAIAEPPTAIAEPPITATTPIEEEGSIAGKWWFWTLIGGAVAIGVGAAVIATTTGGEDFTLDGGDLGLSSTADWRSL